MNVDLRSLIGKLNDDMRNAVEAAAGLCLSRTHYDVEIEHILLKLLDATDSDFAAVLRHFEIDRSRLARDLAAGLDRLKSGNARTPALSPSLVHVLTDAWTIGSVNFNTPRVRTGTVMLALVASDDLSRLASDISRELKKVNADELRRQLPTIFAKSAEDAGPALAEGPAGVGGGPGEVKRAGPTPNLDQYTVNMTEKARQGQMDRVLGRDFEIRQVVDILTRRRQNNPILVGEAGVGKSAIVEGFARRIVDGDVPPPLRNVTLRSLDLALLQAGAGVKGEFENRLK
ncbi:MAG: type VI secretion system ATPase TssH, partial [Gemmatimonadetes bacterium]|nr:type VI secretion system ATPase TssH [Gemmatimonadota bacterium]